MPRFALIVLFALAVVHCHGEQQVQMPDAAELQDDNDLQRQIKDLQRNVSDIWTYIHELRDAVSNHLNHLRQHQVVLESSMHKMEHLHEGELQSSSDYHHHSGEHSDDHHSHSGEQHSHGGEHSHSGEHHSHGDGDHHSHGDGDHHSHGDGDHHSHSGEHHSHDDEHHSHGDDHGHYSHSHSHSHSATHDHSSEAGHSHGEDHDHHHHEQTTDSVESEDLQQQTQQAVGAPPVSEPVVVASDRRSHSHHHHSSRNDGMNLMNENSLHSYHHHHHHDSSSRRRNRTVEIPKFTDYGLYDLAICDVTPNRAIPEDQQQNVVGAVTLWQKKSGGPLNFHVQLQGFDVEGHHGHHQTVQQDENNDTPQIGHKHGFHIHSLGDLSNGCQSTGPHYNPKGSNHGGPNSMTRHIGDLGMISCDDHGKTNIVFGDDVASLRGPYSIIGKSLVIHALEDDLGQGGNEESLKTGNAGTRIACCLIRRVDKIPMRQYRAMKYATQRQNR